MAIRSLCPGCRTAYDVPDELTGRKVRCQRCQQIFLVEPTTPAPATTRAVASKTQRPPAPPPEEEPFEELEEAPPEPRRGAARRSPPRRPPARKKAKSKGGLIMGICVVLLTLLVLGGTFAVAGYYVWTVVGKEEAKVKPTATLPPNFSTGPFTGGPRPDGFGPAELGDTKEADYEAKALATVDPGPILFRPKLPITGVEEQVPPPLADGSLPQEVLKRVKDAVPLLNVTMGDGHQGSGSGFLVEPGIVITNRHVVGTLSAGSRPPKKVDVVFFSGEANELTLSGEVVGQDPVEDLAIVRVKNDPKLPQPLIVTTSQTVSETQPVFVVGFPGGPQRSKNVTVTRSSVSSLIKEGGRLKTVQVFGGMNPGNSGGPVVDAQGRVVGVAVSIQTIPMPGGKLENTGLNYAIPSDMVRHLLHGEITGLTLDQPRKQGEDLLVPYTLELSDQRGRIAQVDIAWWLGKPGPQRPASPTPPAAREGDGEPQTVPVRIQKGAARGDLKLPAPPKGQVVWIQVVVTEGQDDAAEKRWSEALPYEPPPPLDSQPLVLANRPREGSRGDVAVAARAQFNATVNDTGVLVTNHLGAKFEETLQGADDGRAKRARALTGLDLGARQSNRPLPMGLINYSLGSRSGKLPDGLTTDKLAKDAKSQATALGGALQQLFDLLEVPLPENLDKPWKGKASLPVLNLVGGPSQAVPLDLTYTPLGVRQRDGRQEGAIRIEGRSADGQGKVRGLAWVDLASGQVFLVRATAEFQTEIHLLRDAGSRAAGVTELRLERQLPK